MRRALVPTLCMLLAAGLPAARADHPAYLRPLRGDILRHFEPPPTPYAAGHRGIDLAAAPGSPVGASAAGVVAFAGQVGGRLFVSIDHDDGLRTTYSFLSEVAVRAGQRVEAGEVVARSGDGHAGEARPHLHFGVRRGEGYLDPEPLLVQTLRRDLSLAVRLAS